MKIRFAFAVNNENEFEQRHFGDTYKFIIYELQEQKLIYISEQKNEHQKLPHGAKHKGDNIVTILKKHNVNVLISKQFGKNITIVSKYFIPVIVSKSKTTEVIKIILNKIHWIKDELKNKNENYQLFTIKSGILKSKIE